MRTAFVEAVMATEKHEETERLSEMDSLRQAFADGDVTESEQAYSAYRIAENNAEIKRQLRRLTTVSVIISLAITVALFFDYAMLHRRSRPPPSSPSSSLSYSERNQASWFSVFRNIDNNGEEERHRSYPAAAAAGSETVYRYSTTSRQLYVSDHACMLKMMRLSHNASTKHTVRDTAQCLGMFDEVGGKASVASTDHGDDHRRDSQKIILLRSSSFKKYFVVEFTSVDELEYGVEYFTDHLLTLLELYQEADHLEARWRDKLEVAKLHNNLTMIVIRGSKKWYPQSSTARHGGQSIGKTTADSFCHKFAMQLDSSRLIDQWVLGYDNNTLAILFNANNSLAMTIHQSAGSEFSDSLIGHLLSGDTCVGKNTQASALIQRNQRVFSVKYDSL